MPSDDDASVLLGIVTIATGGNVKVLPSILTHSCPSTVVHSQENVNTAVVLSGSPLDEPSKTTSDVDDIMLPRPDRDATSLLRLMDRV